MVALADGNVLGVHQVICLQLNSDRLDRVCSNDVNSILLFVHHGDGIH